MSATVEIGTLTVEGYPQIARRYLTEHLTALTGHESISRQKIEQKDLVGSLKVTFMDFSYSLSAPLVRISNRIDAGKLDLTVAIDEGILVLISLSGNFSKDDGLFWIENVGWNIEGKRNRAHSDFVASTFWAMLGLSETVQLQFPELQLNLSLKTQLELPAISEMLQRRLLAYRIMVIERATDRVFELPSFITAENVKSVALIYHAIVHRSFVWPIGFVDYGWPATKKVVDWLVQANELPFIKLGPHPQNEALFGQLISLGEGFVTVQDKTIDDFDRVLEELSRNDGHIVRVLIRSRTGSGAYDLPHAPRLPRSPWDANIESLINLEAKLDARFAGRYNGLAAATLDGLTGEERKEVTARPELDEDAFTFET